MFLINGSTIMWVKVVNWRFSTGGARAESTRGLKEFSGFIANLGARLSGEIIVGKAQRIGGYCQWG